jgi:hypothetical protein
MKNIILSLCFISLFGYCEEAVKSSNTKELLPEIEKLVKKYPLKKKTLVWVVRFDASAWCEEPAQERRIVILDQGFERNKELLRHEWNHLYKKDNGDLKWEDDESANKAEKENQ